MIITSSFSKLYFVIVTLNIVFPILIALGTTTSHNVGNRCNLLSMKFGFSKGSGPLKEMGGIGSQGEYYFIPSKRPVLKAPPEAIGKERVIPLFPRSQVLGPMGDEYFGVYEMRYRQLANEVGINGVFGSVYYSPENSKLALVGTLARIKRIDRIEDGGMYLMIYGVGRFYIRDIKSEKPYLKARVQEFYDYSENDVLMQTLEVKLLNELRYSVKLMKLLYPSNNYTVNYAVLKNRPKLSIDGIRSIDLPGEISELLRRSKFSFAGMEMLKTDPITKLLFLQEPVVEKRCISMLKVLEESTAFLEGELRRRGVITDEGIKRLRVDALGDTSDLEIVPKSSWIPNNFINGTWTMAPTFME